MADLRDKIEAEFENIELLLKEIPLSEKLPRLSFLELAGVATLLHNFYNGIENILKQICKAKNIPLPAGSSWHRDLLNLAAEEKIISLSMRDKLGEHLAFRHFFIHAYALDLHPAKMEPLVAQCANIYMILKEELFGLLQ
ncbi:hypothetical protein [Candidatus Electronema sp. JC]|uniref:ribonuclease toxin HepT-like protein n=1 Tax=Candidatus Electronema sp. JC TaxID=3401570 RepID=UPI003B4315E2